MKLEPEISTVPKDADIAPPHSAVLLMNSESIMTVSKQVSIAPPQLEDSSPVHAVLFSNVESAIVSVKSSANMPQIAAPAPPFSPSPVAILLMNRDSVTVRSPSVATAPPSIATFPSNTVESIVRSTAL